MESLATHGLEAVIAGCQEEEAQKLKIAPGDLSFCYELFRRAIVEYCEPAWGALYTQYRGQMLYWARYERDETEDCIQGAWMKFLATMTPKLFTNFRHKSALLAYLQRCVQAAQVDLWRMKAREQKALEAWGREVGGDSVLDVDPADRIVQADFARAVHGRLQDEPERLVVRLNLELGMKPAEIVQRYPQHFADVHAVYKVLDRVRRRLMEDPVLKARFDQRPAPKKSVNRV